MAPSISPNRPDPFADLIAYLDEIDDHNPFRCGPRELEFARAVRGAYRHQMARKWLATQPAALGLSVTGYGLANIETEGNRWWTDDKAPGPFVVIPVYDHGVLADLIAFTPRKPEAFWLRVDAVRWLNPDAVAAAQAGWSIRLFENPWSWLSAGAPPDGAVPLLDGALSNLLRSGPIECETPQLKRRLQAAFDRAISRRLPAISVRRAA